MITASTGLQVSEVWWWWGEMCMFPRVCNSYRLKALMLLQQRVCRCRKTSASCDCVDFKTSCTTEWQLTLRNYILGVTCFSDNTKNNYASQFSLAEVTCTAFVYWLLWHRKWQTFVFFQLGLFSISLQTPINAPHLLYYGKLLSTLWDGTILTEVTIKIRFFFLI